MLKPLTQLVILVTVFTLGAGVWAEPTDISVQVLSRDAKFVGTSMGGARVIIENVQTGQVLAQGLTTGGTGDTERIMQRDRERGETLATEGSARFNATLDIDMPIKVRVTALGPQSYLDSANSVSATQWLLPGKSMIAGNSWLLELPGLVVNLHDTPSSVKLKDGKAEIKVNANVQMMCGCPLTPKGLWDSEQFEIVAHVAHQDSATQQVPLAYAGAASEFAATLPLLNTGDYTISVWAYQQNTGNSGLASMQLVVID